MNVRYPFGPLLKSLLVRAGHTQQELADHLEVQRQAVSTWVTGSRRPRYSEDIIKAAEFLEASEDETQQLLDAAFIPRQKPQRVTDVTSVDLTLDVAMVDTLKKTYLTHVHAFARALPLAWGTTGNVESAYVHSRLGRIEPPTWPPRAPFNSEQDQGNAPQAETLLFDEQLHAAIIAPTGGGKSALWRQLANRLAHGFAGKVLPVLIDWEQIRAEKIVEVNRLVESAIKLVWPDCPAIPHFAQILKLQLETGEAVALIDNWGGLNALPDQPPSNIQAVLGQGGWKRIMLFSRYTPALDGSPAFDLYSLTALEDQDVRRFVRNWSLVSGKALNAEQFITWLSSHKDLGSLAASPLFLDLICAAGVESTFLQKRGALLEWAIEQMIQNATSNEIETVRFRSLLAQLALKGYQRAADTLPVQYSFDAAEVDKAWRAELGELGARLFTVAYERGLLRSVTDRGTLVFTQPMIQSYLAAEAWAKRGDWLEELPRVKSQPPWSDVVIFTAAGLAHARRLPELALLLQGVCDPPGGDAADLNWLLAAQCLAELDEDTQRWVVRTNIGEQIQKQLVAWLNHPGTLSIEMRLRDILPRLHFMLDDVAAVARGRQFAAWSRDQALSILGEMDGKLASEVLSQIARDEHNDEQVRIQAVDALGHTHSDEALAALESLLNDSQLRPWVLAALAIHNTPNAARLLLRVWDGTQAVGQAIERLSNPHILPILKQALEKTANKLLIHYVFPAIASIGGDEAIDVLKRYMQHKQSAVFEQAVGSLGDIPQPAACLALLDYAEGKTHVLSRRSLAVSALPHDHGLWDADRLIALMLSAEDIAEAIEGTAAAAHKRRTELYILAGSAAAVLAQTADTTVSLRLAQTLTDTKAATRCRLVTALAGKSDYPNLIPMLTSLAHDRNHCVREVSIVALSRLHAPGAADLLVAELEQAWAQDHAVDELCRAVRTLKEKRALPLLRQIVESDDIAAVHAATEALGSIGGADAAKVLRSTWRAWSHQHRERQYRQVFAQALAENGEADTVRFLIELAAAQTDLLIQIDMLHSLRRVRNPAAVDVLIEALSHPLDDVRDYAAEALGHIGDERAVPSLITLAFDPIEWVRESAIKATREGFTHIRRVESIQAAAQALRHSEVNVRYIALLVLAKATPERVSPEVLRQIRDCIEADDEPHIRRAAVKALGKLEGPHATPYLCERLRKSTHEARTLAFLETLHDVGDPRAVETMVEVLQLRGSTGPLDMIGSPWLYLLRLEFLTELLRFLPATQPIIARLSFAFEMRVLPDDAVFLSDGRRITRALAMRWLKAERQI